MSINRVTEFSKREPVLTVEVFKRRFLHGVDLRDANGEELPDEAIQDYIDISIDYIEHELNCPITEKEFEYYEDYMYHNYRQYAYIQLPVYPLIDVTKITLTYGYDEETDSEAGFGIEFPKNWYKIYASSGQVQLLPTVATVNSLILTGTGFSMRALRGQYLPMILKAEYKAGFGDEVPLLINQAIGLMAAVYMLQLLGDIGPGGGAGISSQSVSLDGMSQSLSTAISATNNLFGATIAKYQELLDKKVMKALKRKYKRISLAYI